VCEQGVNLDKDRHAKSLSYKLEKTVIGQRKLAVCLCWWI